MSPACGLHFAKADPQIIMTFVASPTDFGRLIPDDTGVGQMVSFAGITSGSEHTRHNVSFDDFYLAMSHWVKSGHLPFIQLVASFTRELVGKTNWNSDPISPSDDAVS